MIICICKICQILEMSTIVTHVYKCFSYLQSSHIQQTICVHFSKKLHILAHRQLIVQNKEATFGMVESTDGWLRLWFCMTFAKFILETLRLNIYIPQLMLKCCIILKTHFWLYIIFFITINICKIMKSRTIMNFKYEHTLVKFEENLVMVNCNLF